ncbi:MAG: hypothetical protein AAF961_07620 [Planctomycetota bacterium]
MPRPTVALVNDTSLYEHHFGCQLVCQTFREQFARVGLELRLALPFEFRVDEVHARLATVDLVVVNGEGSLHHGRGSHLLRLAESYPTALVNCVYQSNGLSPALRSFRFRSARESLSAAEIRSAGVACDVTPDLLFASQMLRSYAPPLATEELGFTDSVERRWRRYGPFRRRFGFSPYVSLPSQYLDKLCSFRRICAGRFHAAVACSVLGVPFSTWDSNSWKTRGLMRDMGVERFHFSSFEAAVAHVPKTMDDSIAQFAVAAVARIEGMFDKLALIARDVQRERGRRIDGLGVDVQSPGDRAGADEFKGPSLRSAG